LKRTVNKYSSDFKTKVVLEVLREEHTVNELASKYQVNPRNIQMWRKQFLENTSMVFENSGIIAKKYQEKINHQSIIIDELHRQIGQLSAEINWAKKKSMQAGVTSKAEIDR